MERDARAIREELLVRRCQRGDRHAFEALFREWERPLIYYIRQLVDQEADAWDALQKTWVEVLRSIGRLREPRALRLWLYRLARNTAISHGRLQVAYQSKLEPEGQAENVVDDDWRLTFEEPESVHSALERLSLPQREVLTLHFLEDLSIEEIAALLEVPCGTVKSRLHYAKRALRDLLKEDQP